MPYIPKYRRVELTSGGMANSPGELNYKINKTILAYMRRKDSVSYSDLNEVIGVLESVKQEFYRRVVAPYEDSKIKKNGDIYD
jgi:hypothetical protein